MIEKIEITTDYIKLDQFLKLSGAVGSGGDAKFLITNGYVKVNDQVMLMRGKKLLPGDKVFFSYEDQEFLFEVSVAEE
jgi:ribosome-associated protein